MNLADYIGSRGEAIAVSRMTKMSRTNAGLPYFYPHFLGEKCETFDFLVEIVDEDAQIAFFFAQVKTTQKDLTKTQVPQRLRIEVSDRDIQRMASYPAPTYIIGVHEPQERVFAVRVLATMNRAIPSITTAHELNDSTMERLWDEVRAYWRQRVTVPNDSTFTNEN